MTIKSLALQCRDAAQVLSQLSAQAKQDLLEAMAAALEADAALILAANVRDLDAARAKGTGTAMLDRLALDDRRLAGIAAALREVAQLPDPVGQVTRDDIRPNGIRVQKVRVPLGVIAMIYEARPNVTADAAALCIKAGNGVILRGGSEAIHSNTAIAQALQRALRAADVPEAALTLVQDLRRETMLELLQLTDIVDLAIPRGGEGLIRFVAEHARVPVIKHYKGVCHLFVDASADLELAVRLLVDGKASRPSACNALETLLVHADIAGRFLPLAAQALRERKVELRGDAATCALVPEAAPASADDYAAEFLDLILAIRVVPDLEAAIAHIRVHGSDHTEVIATQDAANAERFVQALRAAVVMVNASSRFSDGGELGLGAEIGISTTRLHSYGPMGLEALTVERFVVRGEGQVRH
ncbi:glutamate-5-semialdehyde dehydrogenase [Xanthomonas sp. NCPPB 1067]|uniref:Gamma-glutamyl phosphate reductase n=1 Tax=Xanthomonas melonis TaxID=56456 RepID=A0A2S7DGG3_9XANT|nr:MULTISPECIES: glutamate-5-semialdehyde dehydrogenase [Xanthomonas]MCC4587138.1 glutamate-5-semialdehyde dehydrogenase [Xanthomonas sp. NCPPB 1067]MCC4598519.1 glutamate-5-semialdehyde dehydrogenase [Xanthomonas melonis]MCD0248084.1 glutamate-5-semialdehyde dehydrogenase [Xanthomonas melonis]MCD0278884.1 glutamate-5-semialdehyde dehydrogenase [Xanthomonas melonis]PPU72913.1 glutamate-5-semialdehyde dehydrogenase [Xanthomonas melonis]